MSTVSPLDTTPIPTARKLKDLRHSRFGTRPALIPQRDGKGLMLKISIVGTGNEIRLFLDCANLIPMAEQELAAFFNAVTESFGSEQAGLSAEDWLEELMVIDALQIG